VSFKNLTQAGSLLPTLGMTSCVRDIKRVVNIFKGASIYISNNPVKSKNTKIYNL